MTRKIVIFFTKLKLLATKKKWAKRDLFAYQPQSGTALAYKFAQQKKKCINNFLIKLQKSNTKQTTLCYIINNE